ncbi:MAG: aminodeoxychorismate synthase component I [Candidatus Omnitrophota bacterium]
MAYYILKSYKLSLPVLNIFAALSRQRHCFFLDSSLNSGGLGRFSFLGADPYFVLRTDNKNPFAIMRQLLECGSAASYRKNIPFWAGAVGYLSYDLGFTLEGSVKKRKKPASGVPECVFGFYNTAVIVDHYKRLLYVLSLGLPEKKSSLVKKLAELNFKKLRSLLAQAETRRHAGGPDELLGHQPARINSDFSRNDYIKAVKLAKEYIRRGDIYQVNLSQQFNARSGLSGQEIYRRLRLASPACFSAYFDAGDFQIISSSPERFLKLERGAVSTRPMKGTRPRADQPLLDKKHRQELLASAKDKAELLMIVDLERNDLGRVCDYGSVTAPRLRQLEKYRTVFQTTATVTGSLHKTKDRLDLLEACFPGGSITGCPKIRAMEIIEELEPARRGIYTGSLGYLSFSGGMDFNIMIRTILKKGDRLSFGAGGGIVADSDPAAEYEETLIKAKGMFEAIGRQV